MDGIRQINNEINNAIATFLNAKKTVILIPSITKLDTESFNKNLSYLNINIVAIDSSKQTLNQIEKKNRFFKDVFESTNANLQFPFFKNHYNIKKSANHQTLLSFENSNPLLIFKNYKLSQSKF